MSLKRFNKIFGIQESEEDEKRRFVQRINQTIFENVEDLYYPASYEKVFRTLCYWLGTNSGDRISRANQWNYGESASIPRLRSLTNDEFLSTLKVLVLLYRFFDDQKEQQEKISSWIEVALSNTLIDLGIRWRHGMFYPSGAKMLDEQLIEEPFDWLEGYRDEKRDFLKALSSYSSNDLGEVVINCYLVVEGLARKILNNSKTLENNREELVKNVVMVKLIVHSFLPGEYFWFRGDSVQDDAGKPAEGFGKNISFALEILVRRDIFQRLMIS